MWRYLPANRDKKYVVTLTTPQKHFFFLLPDMNIFFQEIIEMTMIIGSWVIFLIFFSVCWTWIITSLHIHWAQKRPNKTFHHRDGDAFNNFFLVEKSCVSPRQNKKKLNHFVVACTFFFFIKIRFEFKKNQVHKKPRQFLTLKSVTFITKPLTFFYNRRSFGCD
jgi:hypothetical protein